MLLSYAIIFSPSLASIYLHHYIEKSINKVHKTWHLTAALTELMALWGNKNWYTKHQHCKHHWTLCSNQKWGGNQDRNWQTKRTQKQEKWLKWSQVTYIDRAVLLCWNIEVENPWYAVQWFFLTIGPCVTSLDLINKSQLKKWSSKMLRS